MRSHLRNLDVYLSSNCRSLIYIAVFLLLIPLAFSPMSSKGAEKPVSKAPATELKQSYTWFDGDTERTVWLNPSLLAEFNPKTTGQSPVKQFYGDRATEQPNRQAYIKLWQFDGVSAETAVRELISDDPKRRLSVVFHDLASANGNKRALPGNIIVFFKPSWEGPQVQQWAKTHRLNIVKKLPIGAQVYEIETAPGFKSLETANMIYKTGEVTAAVPNWWEEVEPR